MAKRILVVDDDIDTVEMIEKMLASADYEVIVAHDGLNAVERANAAAIDLILLDMRLPFFSGLWFCNAFKQKANTKKIPIVMISGLAREEDVKKAYELGAADYLKKPFNTEELLKTVQKNLL